jgi:ABC-type multidrug transport system ATPase subunit
MEDSVIRLRNVTRKYGKKTILDGISLDIRRSEVYGLVGLNGAGKTTLIRILAGLLDLDDGECRVLSQNPWSHKGSFYRRLGLVLEHSGFSGNLTFKQNLDFFASVKRIPQAAVKEYLDANWSDTSLGTVSGKVKVFSRGERMQCSLCRAFLGWPDVYLFDEPAIALDIKAYDHFCGLVRQAKSRGAAVLISSHQMDAVEELCDTVGILENGKLSDFQPNTIDINRWIIKTDNNPLYGDCILSITGCKPEYTGGAWEFSLKSRGDDLIGTLVTRLTGMGAAVSEVRRNDHDLRSSLRRYFQNT